MPRSTLFVTTFNAGTARLLALHGVAAHGLRFVRLAELLPDWRIVAPDLRGHGRSPADPPWAVEQHVQDLLPLLEEGGAGETVVLGHSFGGLIAWELARSRADSVARLILLDPAIGVSADVAQDGIASVLSCPSFSGPAEALEAALVGRSAGGWWAAALDVAAGMTQLESGQLGERSRPEALVAAWQAMRAPLCQSAFRGPTLLVEAARERGRYVSPGLVAALRRQLGGLLTHVRMDAPHTLPVDAPEETARLIGAWLDRRSSLEAPAAD